MTSANRSSDGLPIGPDLKRAMRSLTAAQYDAVLYVYIMGYTEAEAGGILGCGQRALHDRLDAALKKLKRDTS